MEKFKRALGDLRFALEKAEKADITMLAQPLGVDFRSRQRAVFINDVKRAVVALKEATKELHDLVAKDSSLEVDVIKLVRDVAHMQEAKDVVTLKNDCHRLRNALVDLEPKGTSLGIIPTTLPFLPDAIRSDIESDLAELKRCYESSCYRSVVILCGRILEIALHSKYYQATGTDLLEKAPGTGLGNLIKKLAEQNVVVDPALTNQIHVINQVRVNSVHVKHNAFNPSKDQAHAMALYTIDVLKKLFV